MRIAAWWKSDVDALHQARARGRGRGCRRRRSRRGRCASAQARFSRRPRTKLSRTTISSAPASTSSSVRLDPIAPAPPVTSTLPKFTDRSGRRREVVTLNGPRRVRSSVGKIVRRALPRPLCQVHEAARRAPRPPDRRQPDQRDRSRRGRRGGRSRRRRLRRSGAARRPHRGARPRVRPRAAAAVPARAVARSRSSPTLARSRRLDLIHAYEWPPCLDAYYGAHLLLGVPLVCTVLSMSVSPLVPRSIPLDHGHRGARRRGAADASRARVGARAADRRRRRPSRHRRRGVPPRAAASRRRPLLVVTVSRLAIDLKLDALVAGHRRRRRCSPGGFPVRLAIVGGGPAAARAERARRRGQPPLGPRGRAASPARCPTRAPAYAAADVVVGMGSSALRAMSIGRPVVVQGERGFSKPFEPDDAAVLPAPRLLGPARAGLDRRSGSPAQLAALLADPARRAELGAFGRRDGRGALLARRARWRASSRSTTRCSPAAAARARPTRPPRRGARVRLELDNHDPRRKRARRRTRGVAARRRPSGQPPMPEAPAAASRDRPSRRGVGRARSSSAPPTTGTTSSSPTGTWPSG